MPEIHTPEVHAPWWRQLAVLAGAPIFGAILAWQLYTTDPQQWCKTAFDVAKLDNTGILGGLQSCITLQMKLLDIKDHAILGLLLVMGMGYLMMLAREYRINAAWKGPGGFGGSLNANDSPPVDIPIKMEGTINPSPEKTDADPGN